MIVHARDYRAQDRVSVAREVVQHLSLDVDGLHLILEADDLKTFPNRRYQTNAFSMNVAIGGCERISPAHVLSIMERAGCSHVIWVSRDVVRGAEGQFIWVCAHELQHARQNLSFPHLAETFGCLRGAIPRVLGPCNQLSIPTELDAEIVARATLGALRGPSMLEQHVHCEIESDPRAEAYFVELLTKQGDCSGDLLLELRRVIAQNVEGFQSDLRVCQEDGRFSTVDLTTLLRRR